MSRVDDERQAQRVEERLLQEKRLKEIKAKEAQQQETVFSKLVQKGQAQTQQQERHQSLAKAAVKATQKQAESGLLGSEATKAQKERKLDTLARSTVAKASHQAEEQLHEAHTGQESLLTEHQEKSELLGTLQSSGRDQDHGARARTQSSRQSDADHTQSATEERSESNLKGGAQAGRAGGSARKIDQDGQGKGQGQSGQGGGNNPGGKDGADAAAASFRLNPALLAPAPVAKPRMAAGSDRLRLLANEIAQKIVERARVGTNAAGNAEFQIDLRSNVLSGLSIKLSSRNGRIKAVFSGNDREVLKMLQEQRERIQKALTERGLSLEELRVEFKA